MQLTKIMNYQGQELCVGDFIVHDKLNGVAEILEILDCCDLHADVYVRIQNSRGKPVECAMTSYNCDKITKEQALLRLLSI